MNSKITLFSLLISLFYFTQNANSQIPNQGFETWVTDVDGNLNPAGWETTNSDPDVSVSQYTPAYLGNFSMMVETWDPGFMAIGGFATIGFPYNLRPSHFKACLKTTVMPGDGVYIIFALMQGDSIIAAPGNCTFHIDSTVDEFTCFTFPITYQSNLTPDSATIMVVAGVNGHVQVGTQIIVDDLSFDFSSGITENNASAYAALEQNIPNPASGSTYFPLLLNENSSVDLSIYDVLGKEVKSTSFGFLNAGEHQLNLSVIDLAPGIYQCTFSGNNFNLTKKISVN